MLFYQKVIMKKLDDSEDPIYKKLLPKNGGIFHKFEHSYWSRNS